jgi:hypothetical protein
MKDAKQILNKKLIDQNRYWSFDMHDGTLVPDDILIEKTLLYLDIEEINSLFTIYPYKKIKQVWRDRLVIQGDYYRKINKLLAWMYFGIKNPDKYISTTITRHINKLS